VQERYTREWLSALAAAGYLDYDPPSERFTLPAAHTPFLAGEGGPLFSGGAYQWWLGLLSVLNGVTEAFRRGGGVPYGAYSADLWEGSERLSARWFDHLLVQQWLPALPEVQVALEAGALVADVGCGRGRALIRLAQTFPRSRCVGYDLFAPNVAQATAHAERAGVAGRVRFEARDAAQGLPGTYDVITTFDVVHDAADPLELLRAIRLALRPGGAYLCLEINSQDRLEDNAGPIAARGYALSVLFCLTTSLAQGGAGLGTRGLPKGKLRALCAEAGFSRVRRAPVENPLNTLYVIQP
jgi:2-polyprenyl-3-methyl-5-hydroxy-6-metoxy-1,4-benzoquinol methylase